MKKGYNFLVLLLILVNFIGIKEVHADDLLDEFNERLVYYLEKYSWDFSVDTSINEKGEKIFNLNFYEGLYVSSYIYKNGIITFDFSKKDILEAEEYQTIDYTIMEVANKALCEIKKYNYDDFYEWRVSLSYDLSIEQDGIYQKWERFEHENGFSSEYITEYSIDLVNGFKSYESDSNKALDDKIIKKEDIEDEEEKNTNKLNLEYFIIVFLLLIGIVEIGIIIFSLIKKKKVSLYN